MFYYICCRAAKTFSKINKLLDQTSYFRRTTFKFDTRNVKNLWLKLNENDQKLFKFNLDFIDWTEHLKNSIKYGQLFMFNEKEENFTKNKKRVMIFAVIHYSFTAFVVYLLYKMFYSFVSLFL